MKDANITVALNTGWTNPDDINSSSWMYASPFTVENDIPLTATAFSGSINPVCVVLER